MHQYKQMLKVKIFQLNLRPLSNINIVKFKMSNLLYKHKMLCRKNCYRNVTHFSCS